MCLRGDPGRCKSTGSSWVSLLRCQMYLAYFFLRGAGLCNWYLSSQLHAVRRRCPGLELEPQHDPPRPLNFAAPARRYFLSGAGTSTQLGTSRSSLWGICTCRGTSILTVQKKFIPALALLLPTPFYTQNFSTLLAQRHLFRTNLRATAKNVTVRNASKHPGTAIFVLQASIASLSIR